MNSRKLQRVQTALRHLELLDQHLRSGSLEDLVTLDAASLRLAACIEALSGMAPEWLREQFGDDWHAMWGFRNRISHAYIQIDTDLVRDTISRRVPVLKLILEQAIRDLSEPSSSDAP